MSKVSIIMRSKNSDWVIAQSLAALYSQSFKDFELIIVDSGSTDKTLEIIKSYPHKLIQIEPQNYFPGTVLNMTIEKCEGEIIIFQNSDAVPLTSETLNNLLKAFEDNQTQAAFARQIPRPDAATCVRRDYSQSFPDSSVTPDWITLSLPLAAMRKSIWKKHKFYTDAWASEDTEWGKWAKDNSYKIAYMKDSLVMHSHNYTLKQLYCRKYVEGEADAFIYNKKANIISSMINILKFCMKDLVLHLSKLDVSGLVKTPFRVWTAEYAYYKGNKLGQRRKIIGQKNANDAQKVIINNYNDGRQ